MKTPSRPELFRWISDTFAFFDGRIFANQFAVWLLPGEVTQSMQVQLGLLMASPLLALALFAWAPALRWPAPSTVMLTSHGLLILFLFGTLAATPGAGSLDSRFFHILFPALAVAAAACICRALDPGGPATALAVGLLLLLTVIAAMARLPHDYTLQFHVLRRLGLLSLAIVFAWAALATWGASRWRAAMRGPTAALAMGVGLLPPLLFAVELMIHHAPRAIWSAGGGAMAVHFLPVMDSVAAVLGRLLGT